MNSHESLWTSWASVDDERSITAVRGLICAHRFCGGKTQQVPSGRLGPAMRSVISEVMSAVAVLRFGVGADARI